MRAERKEKGRPLYKATHSVDTDPPSAKREGQCHPIL